MDLQQTIQKLNYTLHLTLTSNVYHNYMSVSVSNEKLDILMYLNLWLAWLVLVLNEAKQVVDKYNQQR